MYRVLLGQTGRPPALGNPRSLMHDIYDQWLKFVLESVGPDYLPAEWVKSHPAMVARMEQQKTDYLGRIEEMAAALEEARPHLDQAQLGEITVRLSAFGSQPE